ncbi:hypothetical protein DYBT9275_01480 [Dyadobacter sp. CECT 9275]|uniref:DUF4142 domain-containing protein n=1 Tax=Dyadobacter helix TaxID=2822344 RepID=A0A916J9G7_9BACT|nr:hypothetical protein [Dyadobacter sp. CECT 9275]CAG4994845.1 hypothetical protein DYBT9275_01480 [Dyadobacter sp. CECT 9275]
MRRAAILLVIMAPVILSAFAQATIDRNDYYQILSSESEPGIDGMLKKLETEKQSSQVMAYTGAMLMKKAGFVKGVNGKVKTFKKGVRLLESEIDANPANVEYRFLRLTIQENAPHILKYNQNLAGDKEAILTSYRKLDTTLKNVIADYSRNSKVLKLTDLEH